MEHLRLQIIKAMPKPRLTYEQAQFNGSASVNPGRFADRKNAPRTEGAIGNAPKHFTKELRQMWKELANAIPTGVAGKHDRQVLEMACVLMHQFRTDPLMPTSRIAVLMQLLSRLGMDPQARTRLQVAPQKPETNDPFAMFMQTLGADDLNANEEDES